MSYNNALHSQPVHYGNKRKIEDCLIDAIKASDIHTFIQLMHCSTVDLGTTSGRGDAILMAAIKHSSTSDYFFHYLMDKNIKIDVSDRHGNNPLHYAVVIGDLRVIARLQRDKANLARKPNNAGLTPIGLLYKMTDEKICAALKDKNGDVQVYRQYRRDVQAILCPRRDYAP